MDFSLTKSLMMNPYHHGLFKDSFGSTNHYTPFCLWILTSDKTTLNIKFIIDILLMQKFSEAITAGETQPKLPPPPSPKNSSLPPRPKPKPKPKKMG